MNKSRVTLVFAVTGLVGPMVWLAAWPPSRLADVVTHSIWFFYTDVIELLWPMSMMGPWIGVPLNLMLFVLLGLAVAWLAQTRSRLVIAYAAVAVLAVLFALWQAGFAVTRVDGFALMVALLLYGIPFWIVMHASTLPRSA